jgi:hypothetical protein
MEKIIKLLSVLLIFFLSIGIANAEDILGEHKVEDITYYNSSDFYNLNDYNYVVSTTEVLQGGFIDFDEPFTINISSDTYTVNVTSEEINFYTIRSVINITDSNGTFTSDTADIHYVALKPIIRVLIAANGYPSEGVRLRSSYYLFDVEYIDCELIAPTWIKVETNELVTLKYEVVTAEEAEETATSDAIEKIINELRGIPFIGDILADSMMSLKLIFEVFLALVLFAITGWAILFLLFETFVLAHAIAAMKMSGGGIVGVTSVFTVIASDNYIMIMFVVNLFTKMFTLLVDLARTIWNLIPFI